MATGKRVALSAGLLIALAVGAANATTIHGLGFDTPLLADLADRSADSVASELPVSDGDKALVAEAIRVVLLDSFLPGGPTDPTQLFDNGFNDITADNYGNPLSIARGDFNTSLGVVGPYVDRVLGSPRLELLVETESLSDGYVEAWLYTSEEYEGEYVEFHAVGSEVTSSIWVEFMFDGYAPEGWLENIIGDTGPVPGISDVTLYYAEAESASDDISTLSFTSVALEPLESDIWIGAASVTPGTQIIYYYDVTLDTAAVTPEGSTLSGIRLPDPRNMQWVDRGALDRLAAAGLGFGSPGDTTYFDPSGADIGERFASIAARELLGEGDLGLASTFAAPAPASGQLWSLSFTEDLYYDFFDDDYELVVEVYDGDSIVDYTDPVSIMTRYEPDATMNLATAALTLLDNELFTVSPSFKLYGSMDGGGAPLTGADGASVYIYGEDGSEVFVEPDEEGLFEVTLLEGSYLAVGSADGYDDDSVGFDLFVGSDVPSLDFVLGGVLDFSPAHHEVVQGDTELIGSAGDVTGGVAPYTYTVTGGSAAFWLSVDSETGDLVFADGVTEVPAASYYELDVDVTDADETAVSGTVTVDIVDAPDSTLEADFESFYLTEGAPTVAGVLASAYGGVEPYAYAVTGGTASSWLDVDPTTGDLVFADGVSYVPAPGIYDLTVEATDSAELPEMHPGAVEGTVTVEVSAVSIDWIQLSTGSHKVWQTDLDAGDVIVILNLVGDAESLADVSLVGPDHTIVLAPEPSGDAAFVYLSADDIVSATTLEPAYGRYAIFYTPNGGSERTTTQFLNIVQTPEQGWQGELWVDDGLEGYAHIDFGAAVNASTTYDPVEDVVAPPSPDPEADVSMVLNRDGIDLSRDIVATEEGAPLVWYFDVTLPHGDGSLDWWFDDADQYYDTTVLENLDTGESFDLYSGDPVTVVAGTHSFMLTFDRSPYQKQWLELAPSWSLMSLPGPAVEGNFDALAAGFDVDTIYAWDPAAGYDGPIVGSDPLEHVTRGYFVHRDGGLDWAGGEISVDLDDPTAVQADIPVATGWNIVGVVDGGIDVGSISSTLNTVFAYDVYNQSNPYAAGPMASGDLLYPYQGVWVFNPDADYIASVTQLRYRSGSAGSPAAEPQRRPLLDWTVSLSLDTADGQARRVEIGGAELADKSYDALDIVTPPPPASATYAEFYANVDHIAGRLARSIQPAGRDGGEWELTARLAGDGVIRWDGAELPQGYRLTLHSDGARHDMLRRGEAVLGGGRHALRVTLEWVAPRQTRLLSNYPNPFNPETWIPFELSAASDVTVRIYDIGGKVMRRVDLGYRDAGYYTGRADAAYWDGRNELGERVASGVYFYELRAGTERSLRRMVVHK